MGIIHFRQHKPEVSDVDGKKHVTTADDLQTLESDIIYCDANQHIRKRKSKLPSTERRKDMVKICNSRLRQEIWSGLVMAMKAGRDGSGKQMKTTQRALRCDEFVGKRQYATVKENNGQHTSRFVCKQQMFINEQQGHKAYIKCIQLELS
jgi:hypothetical protein